MNAPHPSKGDAPGKIRSLACCVCGERCRGRQWWNRDTGWGICVSCADWCAAREPADEHRENYGERGVHYAIAEG